VAVRKGGGDRDPLPALGTKSLRFGLELLDHQAVEQRRVLEPTAIVMLEEIAYHDATGGLVGVNTDELCPLVGRPNRAFRELAADVVGLLVVGARELLPDLLLPRMVVCHRERHQLLQGHAVLGVDLEEFFGNRGELEPLFDHGRAHEEPGRDFLLGQCLLAQGLECAKLVERMQGDSLDVLGERILLGEAIRTHDAGHRLRLVHALLLDQELERSKATAAGRHLEHTGLLAIGIQHRPHVQALQERAPGDIFGKLFERNASLHPAYVRLAQHQLVEGDIA
jgi:hypothetical protein